MDSQLELATSKSGEELTTAWGDCEISPCLPKIAFVYK
jgi:hypothetical protein